LSLSGCSIAIHPAADIRQRQTVYVCDYGDHASLLLPRGNGRVAEFAYGEWGWFALGRQGWYRAVPAIGWPTTGTLGTRDLAGPATPENLEQQIGLVSLLAVPVEHARIAPLLGRLDLHFAREREREVHNADLGMTFVPYPMPYCLFCQCNSMVAQWLREMGCRTRGFSVVAAFTLAEADHEQRVSPDARAAQPEARDPPAGHAPP